MNCITFTIKITQILTIHLFYYEIRDFFVVKKQVTSNDHQFAFLVRSAAGRRMTAEDELEQLSGSTLSCVLGTAFSIK